MQSVVESAVIVVIGGLLGMVRSSGYAAALRFHPRTHVCRTLEVLITLVRLIIGVLTPLSSLQSSESTKSRRFARLSHRRLLRTQNAFGAFGVRCSRSPAPPNSAAHGLARSTKIRFKRITFDEVAVVCVLANANPGAVRAWRWCTGRQVRPDFQSAIERNKKQRREPDGNAHAVHGFGRD